MGAVLVPLVFTLAAPVAAAADMAAGRETYQREDYAASLSEWRRLAEPDIVEGGMSDVQLAQTQKLVREWKSK